MNSKLFIAEKVKVGFNPRTDTYSGKLGYVIGYDGKKWRKEPSWDVLFKDVETLEGLKDLLKEYNFPSKLKTE